MKVFTCASTGQSISLLNQIASSGEGTIWQTNLPSYVAKIYHTPDRDRVQKLRVMVTHRPQEPNAHLNHISFAWPKSLLQDSQGNYAGFLMPKISGSVELLEICNPQRRKKVLPGFNWLYLHTTALNIASLVDIIHQNGYILGDIKPQNILVNNRALPSIIDTDSFQVRHPETGKIYPCLVGSEGFTPVELLSQDLATVEQTPTHDYFRLSSLIYLLLFADLPFKGKWIGSGDSPEPTELIRQGFWPYAPHSLIQPGPLTIPLETVHPDLQKCFRRCFNDGQMNPKMRPTAREWVNGLRNAIADLTICPQVSRHYYSRHFGKCYWCDRATNLGVDIFSDRLTVAAKRHPKQVTPAPKTFTKNSFKRPVQTVLLTPPRPQPQRYALLKHPLILLNIASVIWLFFLLVWDWIKPPISEQNWQAVSSIVVPQPPVGNSSALEPWQNPTPRSTNLPTPLPSFAPVIPLKSVVGLDYKSLETLLIARNWKAANEETLNLMSILSDRQSNDTFNLQEITAFPCEDLRTIDQLWMKYSQGKFGFSVQLKIWQEVEVKYSLVETVSQFGDRIGWRKNERWLDYEQLNFSFSAPKGHLPIDNELKHFGWLHQEETMKEAITMIIGLKIESMGKRIKECQ